MTAICTKHVFQWFLLNFKMILKNLENCRFMPEKPCFFAFSRQDFQRKNVREMFKAARPDDPIGLIFGTNVPTYIYNKSMDWIWLIFIFG